MSAFLKSKKNFFLPLFWCVYVDLSFFRQCTHNPKTKFSAKWHQIFAAVQRGSIFTYRGFQTNQIPLFRISKKYLSPAPLQLIIFGHAQCTPSKAPIFEVRTPGVTTTTHHIQTTDLFLFRKVTIFIYFVLLYLFSNSKTIIKLTTIFYFNDTAKIRISKFKTEEGHFRNPEEEATTTSQIPHVFSIIIFVFGNYF